jgi:MFS transporter, FSR family, fosmidomycin resistance protein
LRLPTVWLCFSFFFWTTSALSAIQSFASPALSHIYGLPVSTTALVVTAYMVCGAVGMVAGGWLMGRVQRLEVIITWALLLAAALLALVATGWLHGWGALAATALAGVGTGLAGPSRDMLVKQVAPPGATGRVYGMVYSGLDIGFALSAPVFGALLDHGLDAGVFWGAAVLMLMGVGSAKWAGAHARAR